MRDSYLLRDFEALEETLKIFVSYALNPFPLQFVLLALLHLEKPKTLTSSTTLTSLV